MGCHTWFSRPVTEEELSVFKSHAIEDAYNTGSKGGGAAHNNLQPYAVVKYIICAF